MFLLIISIFQFYRRVCTFVSMTIRNHAARLFFAPVEVRPLSLALRATKDFHRGSETKSSPATVTSNTDIMQMALMNKWIVWISDTVGEYVKAHKVIQSNDTVSFLKISSTLETVVAQYKLKNIKEYHIVE
jgi:hypothetical protein